MKKAYWSLLCFPAAIACFIAALVILGIRHDAGVYAAAGLLTIALYLMCAVQTIWASLADGYKPKASDWVIICSVAAGILLAAMTPFTASEPAATRLLIGSLGIYIVGFQLSRFVDWLKQMRKSTV